MKSKPLILGLAVISMLVASYLMWPERFGFCEKIQTVTSGEICRAPLATSVGEPLLPFALGLLLSSILACLSRSHIFSKWLRFTLWFAAIAAVLMLLAAASEIDIGFLTVSLFDLEKVAQGLAGIYVVSSILLLAVSEMLIRRKG